MGTLPYALLGVHPDGTQEIFSEHRTFREGWNAGQRAVHGDRENAYALFRGARGLAGFCSARLLTSPNAGRPPAMFGAVS